MLRRQITSCWGNTQGSPEVDFGSGPTSMEPLSVSTSIVGGTRDVGLKTSKKIDEDSQCRLPKTNHDRREQSSRKARSENGWAADRVHDPWPIKNQQRVQGAVMKLTDLLPYLP